MGTQPSREETRPPGPAIRIQRTHRRLSPGVAKGNDRAITFYEKHGWALDGQFKDDARFTPPLRELRMSARLVSNG